MIIAGLERVLIITKAHFKFEVKPEAHTFLNSLDSNEETLWRCLIVSVTEEKVEAVMTFEPTECSVFVQQVIHLHIILCKVLTCVQVSESSSCLHSTQSHETNQKGFVKRKVFIDCGYMKLTLSWRRPNLGLALRT